MSTNIFLVQSPLQLVNCIEAAYEFNSDNNVLVVGLLGYDRGDEQIRKLLKFFDWDEVYIFNVSGGKRFIERNIRLRLFLKRFKNRFKDFETLFFGDFRARWMQYARAVLNPKNTYLVDDGDITLAVQEKYLLKEKNSLGFSQTYSRISCFERLNVVANDLMFVDLFLSGRLKGSVNLFTSFNIDPALNQKITVNRYNFLSNFRKEVSVDLGVAFYFGSKYSEVGVLSIKKEMKFLADVSRYLKGRGLKPVYVPHRSDSNEKLLKIEKDSLFEIREFDVPAELIFINLEEYPSVIAGACTSSLNNLKKIYNFKDIYSFMLPIGDIPEIYRFDLIRSYISLKSSGVELVDFYSQNSFFLSNK